MSLRSRLRGAGPEFLVRGYREFSAWYALLTSRNKEFLRFAPPGHRHSPIPDVDDVRRHTIQVVDRSVGSVAGVHINEPGQLSCAEDFAATYAELPFPDKPESGFRYHLDNECFSYGDGVVLYSMMRKFAPKRIVEVGSGFSSAAMLDVNDRFFDGGIELTFVEPHPERLAGFLTEADAARCRIVRTPVQQAPAEVFTDLEADDFLFIDSSHVAKTGSDVLHLLFTVLPMLAPGVVVHFHDVLWPFEYPRTWLDQGRAWNEAYFLRSFLQYNRSFEITYFNSFMATKHSALVSTTMPLVLRRPSAELTPGNAGIWITKRSGP